MGYNWAKEIMKKKIWLLAKSVLAILLLSLVACTKDPTPVNPSGGGSGGGGNSGGGGTSGSAPSAPYAYACEATYNGTEVKVMWNSVSNATKYKVYWTTSREPLDNPYDDDRYTLLKTTSSTSTYHNATPRVWNYYRVKAVNSYGESPMGSYVNCWIGSGKSEVVTAVSVDVVSGKEND